MPFIGRDLKTLTFQRQGQLNELEQKSKNRRYFIKNKQHTKDTGSSLITGRPQKSTLEQYLDKSKIDENIENFIVKELNGNSGQAKIFIQGLDDTLKEYLLDRLPAFKRVFEGNFTIPSVINLKSAFELFNRQQLNKIKDIEIPSTKDLQDYLRGLNEKKLYDLGVETYIQTEKKRRGTNPADAIVDFSNDFDGSPFKSTYIRDVCVNFIRTFETEIDGYIALSKIGYDVGLRDFPKPNLKRKNEGIPTSRINIDIEGTIPNISEEGRELLDRARRRIRTLPPLDEESEEEEEEVRRSINVSRDILGEDIDVESQEIGQRTKGVQRYLQIFNNMNKQDIINLIKVEYESIGNDRNRLTPSQLNRMSKKDLVLELIKLGYGSRNEDDVLSGEEIRILGDYISRHYNTQSGNQINPQEDLTAMEGFGYMSKANKPGLVKIYKLKK